jgi:hypothetical protein
MTQLANLRSNLTALRRRRQSLRVATALCAVGVAAIWVLAAAFALDYRLEAGLLFRSALLLAVVALIAWAWQRFAKPHLAARESDLDMALLVEDQLRGERQPLGRDLVAALQFESPEAAAWGSPALERLVVANVAVKSRALDVFAGLSTETFKRRAALFAVSALCAVVAVAIFPGHARAFFNRLLLGNLHYPTATQIDKIVINGREFAPAIGNPPIQVACAEGQPVSFEVRASHQLPSAGRVDLHITDERQTTVELAPSDADKLADRTWGIYTGKLARLDEPVTYQVYLGDAWTDPVQIEMLPVPVVDARLDIDSPAYARAALAAQRDDGAFGSRSVEVLEGSRIAIEVSCRNKPLTAVNAKIDGALHALKAADAEGRLWRLEARGTPLDGLGKEIAYQISATDADGLAPIHPLDGVIRIKPDRAPRVTAQARTKFVLPTGKPLIEYRVADDYGIARVVAKPTIIRETASGPQRIDRPAMPLNLGDQLPIAGGPQPRTFAASLAPLALAKGDRLELTLEATDYRGDLAGRAASAEPISFQVTDALGVENAVTELDPALEQQIHSLIQKHLDIGASK